MCACCVYVRVCACVCVLYVGVCLCMCVRNTYSKMKRKKGKERQGNKETEQNAHTRKRAGISKGFSYTPNDVLMRLLPRIIVSPSSPSGCGYRVWLPPLLLRCAARSLVRAPATAKMKQNSYADSQASTNLSKECNIIISISI